MSYPTTLSLIGGNSGCEFSLTGEHNGASLEKIGVWLGGWQVRGVKVWLSDGRVQGFGAAAGPYQEYHFQPGECFTSLSLWDSGEGTRLGAIKFKTNQGREFFAKMTDWDLKTEYPIDVGSGYCLGVVGKCGLDIDRMGFMFLNAVQSVVLTNVNYPTMNQLIPQVVVDGVKTFSFRNDDSNTQKQRVETSKKITNKSSWSVSESLTKTFSLEVKAPIPKIVDVTEGFSFTSGSESTYSQEHTEERTENLCANIDVPPWRNVDVVITTGRAAFDMPYTGTVKINCKNGSVLQYDTQGTYKGITYTDFKLKTTESAL